MALTVGDFFTASDAGTWTFFERATNDRIAFTFRARQVGQNREIELDPPAGHRIKSFFDRMAITPVGLELRRIQFTNENVDIQPPFLLTLGPEANETANLFPQNLPGVPFSPPFNGVITQKHVTAEADSQQAARWELSLVSRGRGGDILMRAEFRFVRARGLDHYSGDFYGNFFIYERLPD